MAKKKLIERKKKKREEIAKTRVMRKRILKQKTDKIQKEERENAIAKEPRIEPFMRKETKERTLKEKLEHNMEILKALEEEYDKEMQGKADLDKELTAAGYKTLEERIKRVQQMIGTDTNELNIVQGTGQAHFGYVAAEKGGLGGPV